MSPGEIFAASIAIVVLYNAMQLVSAGAIDAGGGAVRAGIRRLIAPGVPLIDYPPGDPRRQGA